MVYYSAIKRNKLLIYTRTWMDLKELLLNEKKKPVSKGYTLYDSIYITFLRCQNYGDRKQMSGQELGGEVERWM